MKLWELRSYDQVIRMEQERLVYEARLRARYGRGWKRRAPVEALMPLRLARYGVPLSETAPAGLAAAGIEPPAAPAAGGAVGGPAGGAVEAPRGAVPELEPSAGESAAEEPVREPVREQAEPAGEAVVAEAAPQPRPAPVPTAEEAGERAAEEAGERAAEETAGPAVTVPVTPGGRRRSLGQAQANGRSVPVPAQRSARPEPEPESEPEPEPEPDAEPVGIPDGVPREDVYYAAYQRFIAEQGTRPTARQLARALHERDGVMYADGSLLTEAYLRDYLREFKHRYNAEMGLAG